MSTSTPGTFPGPRDHPCVNVLAIKDGLALTGDGAMPANHRSDLMG